MSVEQSAAPVDAMDPRALRRALGSFVTGVTVVTTLDGEGRPRGLTANSFTSVSLDPPLVLVCIAQASSSCAVFAACGGFAVNVLGEEQRPLCDRFAARSADRFAGVAWAAGATGAPRLEGSLASLDCSVHGRVPAGDHMILIGRIEDYAVRPGRPLVFGQGGYMSAARSTISASAATSATRAASPGSTGRRLSTATSRDSRSDDPVPLDSTALTTIGKET